MADEITETSQTVAAGQLRAFIERVERLEEEKQTIADLRWIREDFLDHLGDYGKMVVHGHSISARPDEQLNRIGVDIGAFRTGALVCLALEGSQRWFLVAEADDRQDRAENFLARDPHLVVDAAEDGRLDEPAVAAFRALRYRLSRTWWRGIRGGSDEPGWNYGGEYLGRIVVTAT